MKKKNNFDQPVTKADMIELRQLLDKRFSSVDEKFSGIDKRFSSVDEKFSGIDKRFSDIETGMEKGFERLENKIDETEERLNKRITHVGDLITIDLSRKHQKLEKKVARLKQTH